VKELVQAPRSFVVCKNKVLHPSIEQSSFGKDTHKSHIDSIGVQLRDTQGCTIIPLADIYYYYLFLNQGSTGKACSSRRGLPGTIMKRKRGTIVTRTQVISKEGTRLIRPAEHGVRTSYQM